MRHSVGCRSYTDSHFIVVEAWKTEYRTTTAQKLVEKLRAMHGDGEYKVYSSSVPIIQSSGTGKSRMVDEMAKHIFTIPFNIRAQEDSAREYKVLHAKRQEITPSIRVCISGSRW